jgi:hypothetical protein
MLCDMYCGPLSVSDSGRNKQYTIKSSKIIYESIF